MKTLEIFKLLRKHRKLAEKRAFDYEQNRFAKVMAYIGAGFVIIYLIGIAILLASVANDARTITSIEMMFSLLPFLLVIDFSIRFVAQKTPSQIIKPYVLTPLPRYACIDSFLANSLLSEGNFIWFFLFVPYALMSVVFSFGLLQTIAMLVLLLMIFLVNSQWYLLVRTKINDSLVWWLLPAAVALLIASPIFFAKGLSDGIDDITELWAKIGTCIHDGNPLPFIVTLALLVALIAINRKMQYGHVWKELSKTEQTKLHTVSKFSFLEKYGEIGEFLKLEVKSIMRNKNPRKQFVSGVAFVTIFSLLISFTDVYDGPTYEVFWCIYNFVIIAAMPLMSIMCNEGNYIDALMVHKENILSLLKAKYIFYSALLLIPFLLMLPTVFSGKWSIFMIVSFGVFTAGFQFFIMFQMAVYNKTAMPLNTKFISQKGQGNNYFTLVASCIAFGLPVVIMSVLNSLVSENTSYLIMFLIGLAFILTKNLWMRNIYNRMMKKRYSHLEGFYASRE